MTSADSPAVLTVKGQYVWTGQGRGNNCSPPESNDETKDRAFEEVVGGVAFIDEIDPTNPDEVRGTSTVHDSKTTTTVVWSLTRER